MRKTSPTFWDLMKSFLLLYCLNLWLCVLSPPGGSIPQSWVPLFGERAPFKRLWEKERKKEKNSQTSKTRKKKFMERKTTIPYVPFDKVYSTTFKVALPKKSNLNPIKALTPITIYRKCRKEKETC